MLLSLLFDTFGEALVNYFNIVDVEMFGLPIGCHFGVSEFLQNCLTLAVQYIGEGVGGKKQGLGSSLETLEFLVKRGACDSGLQIALLKSRLLPSPPPTSLPLPSSTLSSLSFPSPFTSSSTVEASTRPVLSIYSDCLCPYLHLAVLQCSNFPSTSLAIRDEDDAVAGVGLLNSTHPSSLAGVSSSIANDAARALTKGM